MFVLPLVTIEEFRLAKEESRQRLARVFEEESKEARRRNQQILREIDMAMSPLSATLRRPSKESLQEAKKKYLSAVEEILPRWKQQQLETHHETLRRLRTEKELARDRRSRIEEERVREERARIAVEQERRELAMMLALENRDRIRANAQAALLKTQGRAVDQAIAQELDSFRRDVDAVLGAQSRLEEPTQEAIKRNFLLADEEERLRAVPGAGLATVSEGGEEEEPRGRYSPHKVLPEPSKPANPAADIASRNISTPAVYINDDEKQSSSLKSVSPIPTTQSTTRDASHDSKLQTPVDSDMKTNFYVPMPPNSSIPADTSPRSEPKVIRNIEAPEPPKSRESVVTMASPTTAPLEDDAAAKLTMISLSEYAAILPPVLRKIEALGGVGTKSQAKKAYQDAHTEAIKDSDVLKVIEDVRSNQSAIDQKDLFLCALVIHVARSCGSQLLPRLADGIKLALIRVSLMFCV